MIKLNGIFKNVGHNSLKKDWQVEITSRMTDSDSGPTQCGLVGTVSGSYLLSEPKLRHGDILGINKSSRCALVISWLQLLHSKTKDKHHINHVGIAIKDGDSWYCLDLEESCSLFQEFKPKFPQKIALQDVLAKARIEVYRPPLTRLEGLSSNPMDHGLYAYCVNQLDYAYAAHMAECLWVWRIPAFICKLLIKISRQLWLGIRKILAILKLSKDEVLNNTQNPLICTTFIRQKLIDLGIDSDFLPKYPTPAGLCLRLNYVGQLQLP